MRMKKVCGAAAAVLWLLFWITLVIRWMAGDGGLMAAEMLECAPPESTYLAAEEYPGVCRMTAEFLTDRQAEFQYDGRFQAHEAAHMEDVRGLIRLDSRVCLICALAAAVLTAAGCVRGGRREFARGMLRGLAAAGIIALGFGIWAAVDFDGLFVTFHRVAFRNDGWLLDPRTDLLIRLMPERFFIRLGIRGGMRALAGAAGIALAAGLARGRKRGNAEKNT